MTSQEGFAACMERLAELIEQLERSCAPASLEPARALLQAVLEVHQSGLRELLEVVAAMPNDHGDDPLQALGRNPSVASLLLMHDLHPESLRERVRRALDAANLDAAGQAHADLVHVQGRRVLVRVHAGQAVAGSLLRRTLDRLICERAPDAELEIEGGGFEPVEQLVPVARLYARGGGAQP
jgi:hypothetical protein